MDCQGVKVSLSHVLSGWSLACTCSTERKKRENYSSACWMCETIWECSPKSTIRARDGSWEIFRRHFRMSRSLLPRESLAVKTKLRFRNEIGDCATFRSKK